MIHINELYDILPINCIDKKIDLLTFNDMNWYIDNLKKSYYEQFMDFKFSSDIQDKKLRNVIYNMILGYKLKTQSTYEARMLLKSKDGYTIYGGCTIFEKGNCDDIELAYFILPQYQGNGLGTTLLKEVCKSLDNSSIPFKRLLLTIRCDNMASIYVAEQAGFRRLQEVRGKYKRNIIMYIDRTLINEVK